MPARTEARCEHQTLFKIPVGAEVVHTEDCIQLCVEVSHPVDISTEGHKQVSCSLWAGSGRGKSSRTRSGVQNCQDIIVVLVCLGSATRASSLDLTSSELSYPCTTCPWLPEVTWIQYNILPSLRVVRNMDKCSVSDLKVR